MIPFKESASDSTKFQLHKKKKAQPTNMIHLHERNGVDKYFEILPRNADAVLFCFFLGKRAKERCVVHSVWNGEIRDVW